MENWEFLPLCLDSPGSELFEASSVITGSVTGPTFARVTFQLEEPVDLFLDTASWGKGVAWINGFNLGRYWTRRPQRTLFIPAGQLHAGDNELVVLELQVLAEPEAVFVPGLLLGHEQM